MVLFYPGSKQLGKTIDNEPPFRLSIKIMSMTQMPKSCKEKGFKLVKWQRQREKEKLNSTLAPSSCEIPQVMDTLSCNHRMMMASSRVCDQLALKLPAKGSPSALHREGRASGLWMRSQPEVQQEKPPWHPENRWSRELEWRPEADPGAGDLEVQEKPGLQVPRAPGVQKNKMHTSHTENTE